MFDYVSLCFVRVLSSVVMVTKESNVGTVVGKARKGKAFVVEEDK
jgi:hypothetical protein